MPALPGKQNKTKKQNKYLHTLLSLVHSLAKVSPMRSCKITEQFVGSPYQKQQRPGNPLFN